ncbi:molybdenum ABC transporter ATP-binding protein [Ruegeria sp. 2205SS24-7]|uniref:molybdenum ABC transporter ATP-binding protein n=1 Tax=Ruegeria discodermiae TaxID=3064389 RepID=UPI002741900C|nr:molybdenum ABC transporter ATP-binding protein [Ruegeria sp. 2205SS24-7]MDP5220319.1 molybdenum ABC transporter ATP-binding protein [Ruegeria sp. 2205SS24-7]
MSLSVDILHPLGAMDLEVCFEAPRGVTALFGASGTGKTSVINAVAGLLRPRTGRIILDGEPIFDTAMKIDLPVHKRCLGCVFQDGRLFPHLNVQQNLVYGQKFAAVDSTGPDLPEVAGMLGISELLSRRPAALSGGEKQRVAIGRALLSRPKMLVMDEPLAALDEPRKQDILPYLERLRDETDIPILYVSHSVSEVARLATTVVMMDKGKVTRFGPAEEILSDPANVRQLGLREAGSVLQGVVAAHHDDGLTEVTVSGGTLLLPHVNVDPGHQIRVRVLAKDIILATKAPKGLSALNILPADIVSIRDGSGPGTIVQLKAGEDLLLARITRRSAEAMALKSGDRVHAVIKAVSVARTDVGGG